MKWIKITAVVAFVALIIVGVYAGTTANQTVYHPERYGNVYYNGTVTFADSASGAIYYTQAMLISALNDNYAFANFQCSEAGTEDVNVFVEYAPTENGPWTAGTTDSNLDAVGTTLVIDTLGIVAGAAQVKYKAYGWMRFKFVAGQNMNSTTLTWGASFKKNSGLEKERVALVKSSS